MHLCRELKSKLESQKTLIKELSNLHAEMEEKLDKVHDLNSFAEAEKYQEEQLNPIPEKFEETRKELEGKKLNFKEEMVKYLGGTLEYQDEHGDKKGNIRIENDLDGYITELDSSGKIKEQNPDLSYCEKLVKVIFYNSSVINPKLSKSVKELILQDCKQLDPEMDFRPLDKLKILKVSYTNLKKIIIPNSLQSLDCSNCKKLDPEQDFSTCKCLRKFNIDYSSIKKLILSPKQFKYYEAYRKSVISPPDSLWQDMYGREIIVKKDQKPNLFSRIFKRK